MSHVIKSFIHLFTIFLSILLNMVRFSSNQMPDSLGYSFKQKDISITNAMEIAAQGEYIYIIDTNYQLKKWNGLTFVSQNSPPKSQLRKITVSENGVLYACSVDKRLYVFTPPDAWTQKKIDIGDCIDISIGYGSNSKLIRLSTSDNTLNAYDYFAYYQNFDYTQDVWIKLSSIYVQVASSGENNDLYFLSMFNSFIKSTIGGFTEKDSLSTEYTFKNSISYSNKDNIWFILNGILYKKDQTNTCKTLTNCVKISSSTFYSVSSSKYDLPWLIDNAGRVYQMTCAFPKDFFDEKNYVCTNKCPVDTIPDFATKRCVNCRKKNQAFLHGECLPISICTPYQAVVTTNTPISNECNCSGSKSFYLPVISTYSPIVKPTTPSCVTNCEDYDLTSYNENLGYSYRTCAMCKSLDSIATMFDEATKVCVANCPKDSIPDVGNMICKNCKKQNKVFLSGECRPNQCSYYNAGEGENYQKSGECRCNLLGARFYYPSNITQYSEVSKLPTEKSCIDNCNKYFLTSVPDGSGNDKCISCNDLNVNKPNFSKLDNTCVNECPPYYFKEVEKKYCRTCKPNYYINSLCLPKSCTSMKAESVLEVENSCKCGKDTPYFFPEGIVADGFFEFNTCIKSCYDIGLTANKYLVCESCEKKDKNFPFLDQAINNCTNTCSKYTIPDIKNKICRSCKKYGTYFYNNTCIAQFDCPRNTIFITTDTLNICQACPEGKKKLNNDCVDNCGSGMIYDSDNVCVKCLDNEYDWNNKCTKVCPDYSVPEGAFCINCKSKNPEMFYYNKVCYAKPPVKTALADLSFNQYVDCKDANPKQYIYKDTCVKKCLLGTNLNIEQTECFDQDFTNNNLGTINFY